MISLNEKSFNIDIDDIIKKLVNSESNSNNCNIFPLQEKQIQALCSLSKEFIANQPMLLELKAPLTIIGDIHGQFHDLLRLIKMIGNPSQQNYLFLGDYVDRGKKSLECFCLLMAYKIKHPQNFFLLRGNHECSSVNKVYGFYDEVKRKLNTKVWRIICNVFNFLPVAAVIQDRIFCVHGGLSPQIEDIRDINSFKRPFEPIRSTPICDMLWSDPCPFIQKWNENTKRGTSYYFGSKAIDEFMLKYDFDLICRSHQVVQEGYEFFHNRKLITVFSAPNYCGEFENLAAVLKIDKNLKCSVEQLKDLKIMKKIINRQRSITPNPHQKITISPSKSIENKNETFGRIEKIFNNNQSQKQNIRRNRREIQQKNQIKTIFSL